MSRRRRRSSTLALVLVPLLLALGMLDATPSAGGADLRPNILLIITDDMRYDAMPYMPLTQAGILDQGVEFTNGFVTTPLCCPSRSSILTGMYVRHHGVRSNNDPLTVPTFVHRLHDAGYRTGIIGKYLNSHDGTPLQQFDFWVHGTGYVNPRLNVNGVITEHTGHQSVVLRDYALEFLADAAGRDQPFLLLFTPFAPHSPAIPAPGDEDLYPDLPPLRPPSHNEADVSDKPAWVKNEQPLTASEVQALDDLWKRQLQTLHSTDQAIDAVLTALEADGALDNTLTVFTSDNGYLFGEHRTQKKGVLYEEAIRVPLAIRYAPLIDGSRDEPKLTANIDLAPTIYELAGIPIPSGVDGRSLVPLLQDGTVAWRDDLLLEHFGHAPGFVGVHTGEWVYVERPGDIPELYDLTTDPYQLTNLSQNPAYDAMEAELRARLAAYDRGGGGSSSSNRILNGGFEQDADANGRPDAWTMNVRFSRSSTIVHGEIFAGRHSATDNAGYTIAQTIGGLVPARTYRVSGWINIPATSDSFTFKLQVRWLNASAATIKTATVKTYKGATAGWNEATASLVAPPGTAQAQVRMVVSSLKAAIYVDDISLLD